jgi:hypothetical protein
MPRRVKVLRPSWETAIRGRAMSNVHLLDDGTWRVEHSTALDSI